MHTPKSGVETDVPSAGVRHPREYRWSSYRANAEAKAEELVTPHEEYLCLGRDPRDRREEYRALFKAHLDETLVKQIRAATNGNYALRNQRFQVEIERAGVRRRARQAARRPKRRTTASSLAYYNTGVCPPIIPLVICNVRPVFTMHELSETPEYRNHEREAVLFNAAVRALGASGYSKLEFDIGGKKARRRYVSAIGPNGDACTIWIKSATHWPGMAEVVRFPWKKLSVSPDGLSAISVACEAAAQRGATHFLAIVGDDQFGTLSFARLYSMAQVPDLAATQASHTDSVFYRAHSAALILKACAPEFAEAAKAANAVGEDILSIPSREQLSNGTAQVVIRARSGNVYRRDPRVRAQVLKIAGGRCECCGQLGFLCHFSRLKGFAGVRGGFSVWFPLLWGTLWIRSFSATAPVICG